MLYRWIVAHVGLDRDDSAIERLDGLDRLGQVIRRAHRVRDTFNLAADVYGDDVGALLRQPNRVTASLSTCRACNERDLAIKSGHVRSIPPRYCSMMPMASASSGDRKMNRSNSPFSRIVGSACLHCSTTASRSGASSGMLLRILRFAKKAPIVPLRTVIPFTSAKFASSGMRCSGSTGSGMTRVLPVDSCCVLRARCSGHLYCSAHDHLSAAAAAAPATRPE